MKELNPRTLSREDIKLINTYFLVETIGIPTDIALLLGNQEKNTQKRIVTETARLSVKGLFNTIAVSGGPIAMGSTLSEAEEMADLLRKEGIASGNILIENHATNTQENVEFIRDMISEKNHALPHRTVTCIGSVYGGRRILMTMKRRWADVTPALKLIAPRPNFKETWQDSVYERARLCREFNKLVPYTKMGFLEEVNIQEINKELLARHRTEFGNQPRPKK